MKSFILTMSSILILSSSCFAVSIPNKLNCTEKNVVWRPYFNPVSVNITFKNSQSSCPSCGVDKFYTRTYFNGASDVVSDQYYSPDTAYLTDINSVAGEKYFVEQCGKYLNDGAKFHLLTSGGYNGPLTCLSCDAQ